jgi:glycosyltransferase involved in cell wall biosynthesis
MGAGAWGGSEELWSLTALDLAKQGFPISASVLHWSPPHKRVLDLIDANVSVRFRPMKPSLWTRAWRKLVGRDMSAIEIEVERLLAKRPPALVVFSDGGPFPWVGLPELCIAKRIPFATVGQANGDCWWVEDEYAERYRNALSAALRCFFVSHANLKLAELQLGQNLSNAEVVWNPFNIGRDVAPPWPTLGKGGELQLACVGRLHPASKGQDILFEALAAPIWANRNWHLNLYGEGPMRDILQRLLQRLGLSDRVTFRGHVAVQEIWNRNHALIMPSRYEGLPLAMIEAMLCGRPVVTTDISSNAEIVEDGVTGFLADAPNVPSFSKVLGRFWDRRSELEAMGGVAAKRIREIIPEDPIRIFSDKIRKLAECTDVVR